MIREARKNKHLTQLQLSRLIGVSQSTISRLENLDNYKCNIDLNVFIEISKVLNLCPMKLLIYLKPSFNFSCHLCKFYEPNVIFPNYSR